jgi:hypothetical protein
LNQVFVILQVVEEEVVAAEGVVVEVIQTLMVEVILDK